MKIQLPIDDYIPDILQKLESANALVLTASPGAGKTTRLPPALLSITDKKVLVLEPRRMAAASSSLRIAEENQWQIGQEVGYEVRFEKKTSVQTKLIFLTEALLSKKLIKDPELKDVGIVVLDEFHERSLHVDLAIGMLKELQELSRPDLKIVVMSATLNAKRISDYLNQAQIVEVPGKLFELKTENVKESQLLNLGPAFIDKVSDAIKSTFNKSQKDILVFLPGVGEINRVAQQISNLAEVLPLHGNLDLQSQLKALKPNPNSRRIILSTNIAESSVTVDGVDTVIDSGLAKVMEWNPKTGLESLSVKRISKSAATQRAGRAARQFPGHCIRLWNIMDERSMPENEKAEILRSDLTAVILTLASSGIRDFDSFSWFEKPPQEILQSAKDFLIHIKAISESGEITNFGKKVAELPLTPRWSALVLNSKELQLENTASVIASMLQEKDFLTYKPDFDSSDSDLLLRLDAIKKINPKRITQSAEQIQKLISAKPDKFDHNNLEILLLKSFPDRLCRRRRPGEPQALMMGGRGVKLSPQSVVHKAEFFIALSVMDTDKDSRVNFATPIHEENILSTYKSEIKNETSIVEQNGKLIKLNYKSLWGLPLEDGNPVQLKADELAQMLPDLAVKNFDLILKSNESLNHWYERLKFLEKTEGVEAILDLKKIFQEASYGEKKVEDLFKKDLIYFFESELDNDIKNLLHKHYPATVTAPTGTQLKINYKSENPSIEVRLQEVFGWMETPEIAGGKVSLVMHLLAPNFRPVQITKDLKSFWKTGYFEVKKELKIRYPKHAWPEDPLTAKPEAKGRRRT